LILVTVGTQLPFDRLIRIVDALAAQSEEPFVAQIGDGEYIPLHMEWHRFIEPVPFDRLLADTRLIISHAGIGTVLNARKVGKPVILFPRQAELGEHRNDHQRATIGSLEGRRGVYIAQDAEGIAAWLRQDLARPEQEAAGPSHEALLDRVAGHIRALGRRGR